MSASDKKKLRKEERLAAMTEKQKQAKKESRNLAIITIVFVALISLTLVFGGLAVGYELITGNGWFEQSAIVATVDGLDLNTIDFSYYYMDAINNYYSNAYNQYGTSTKALLLSYGLDITKPLDKQENPETGDTWASYFMEIALSNAKSDIAIYNEAVKNGYDVNSDEVNAIVDQAANELMWQGYFSGSVETYLRNAYCNGATEASYLNYIRRNAVAGSYYNAYMDELEYTATDIEEYTKDRYNHFSSFTYNYYTISYSKYLNPEEGTKDDKGNVTYTAEQEAAAREAARKDAEALAQCTSLEAFNMAIAGLSFNKDLTTPAMSTASTDVLYETLKEEYGNWLADAERKEFDAKAFPVETTKTDENGKETTVINSYNVIMYVSTNDNEKQHGNVRHILVQFEQTLDDKGNYTVTEDAKKAAKEKADAIYKEWQDKGATKAAFIELAKAKSEDPGVKENEGLYENIHPSSEYLTQFRDWAVNKDRKVGDSEIIETSSGYHIMYFEGYSAETYKDYLVNTSMVNTDMEAWYDGLLEASEGELKDTSRLNTGYIISPAV